MMTVEEKAKRIIEDIKLEEGCNPVRIFKNMAKKEYISIHGPEHHILDGAHQYSRTGTPYPGRRLYFDSVL